MIDDLTINLTATEPPTTDQHQGHNVTLDYDGVTEFGAFRFAHVAEQLAQLEKALNLPAPPLDTLKEAGTALFDELLGGRLFRAYTRATTHSIDRGHKVRLRINSNQPLLMAIPWEYLYDRDAGHWLALRPEISLVRGLPVQRHEPRPVDGPLRVLVMVSDPSDLPKLNSRVEMASLEQIETTGIIDLIWVDPTYGALQSALRQNPHVFHFIGHGTFADAQSGQRAGVRKVTLKPPPEDSTTSHSSDESQGMLAFCHHDGTADLIEADRLSPLLAGCGTLGLVVLNACEGAVTGEHSAFAGLTQRLIQQQIPAVIAMQKPIVDDHAVRFGHEFYAALADGQSVERAMDQARIRINEVAYSWGIPTFYLQASQPFAIEPLAPSQRADFLWQKAQKTTESTRKRQLLEGALAQVSNHAGTQAALKRLNDAEEASRLYAIAQEQMGREEWRAAYQTLDEIQKRIPNYKDTPRLLSEALGKLSAEEIAEPVAGDAPADDAPMEEYLPILNALQEGRLTLFLGGEVSRVGRPEQDAWVKGLYPPGAADAARALAERLPPELQREGSLLKITQYTQLLDGDYALYDRLSELYNGDFTPTVLHRLVAEILARLAAKGDPKSQLRRYVLFSTALDDLLERAFAEARQPYHLFAYRPRFVDDDGVIQVERFIHIPAAERTPGSSTDNGSLDEREDVEPIEVLEPNKYNGHDRDKHPIIVKLCGRRVTPNPDSVAVTEDQYLNYASTEKSLAVLPTTLLNQIKRNSFLFFGHSLQPWHLRLLWQRLRLPSGGRQPPKWAIVSELPHIEEIFWRDQDIDPIVVQPEEAVAYVDNWLESL